ncbi:MAG: xylulokinase [Candidatus Adiutrix sp.]|jgi:xylulokinase|nr:xylulokinase [Candidatus Adiutrix sp.]
MNYLLGIDIGTSGTKTILCDTQGRIAAEAVAEYPVYSPKPGWSEQEPEDWWAGVQQSVRAALARAGVNGADVIGIGLSGQMHGSVFLDKDGRVIRRALLWNDQRTSRECAEITERAGGLSKLLKMVANPAFTGFTAPKILWLRNNEKRNFDRVRQVLLPKDYIRYRLTGVYATEVSDASGTLLLDVARRAWSKKLLTRLDLDPAILPPVFESQEVTGTVTAAAAKALGLREGVPVAGGGGDQAMGAVGNGIVKKGVASAMMGTSGVIFAYTDAMQTEPRGRVHTFCHAVPGVWHMMSCMLSAGGMLQWYRNALCPEDSYDQIAAAAAKAPAGSEGLYCLPYLTGERTPHADPYARGCFIGLTPRHDQAMMSRAVIEGITYGMRDSLDIMRGLGVEASEIRLSGGGAKSAFWQQLQADIYGVDTCVTNSTAGSAYGAMIMGGVGAGVWNSVPEACDACITIASRTKKNPKAVKEYNKFYQPFGSLYQSLKKNFQEIAAAYGWL